jgi:PAS domain S-box-containing protein
MLMELNLTHSFAAVGVTLEGLIEKSGDLVQVMTPQGTLLFTNSRWQEVMGYRAALPNFFALLPHTDDQAHFASWLAILSSGQPVQHAEFTLLTAYAREVVLHGSLIPRLENQQLTTITVLLRDITSIKRYSAEMEHMFELSQDMLGVVTFDGYFEKVNPAWTTVLGYTPAELIGHHYLEFTHPEDQPSTQTTGEQANTAAVMNFENRYVCKDGSFRWLSWNSVPYPAERRIYFVARDVTQRKIIELDLKLRNQAVEASPSGISIADALQPDMPLIYVNPTFERITGYTLQECIGRNCRFLQGTDRNQPAVLKIRHALQEQRSVEVILRNYRKNGEMFYNELRLAPIFNAQGQLLNYVGISTEVTQRVADQAKIEQQNEALLRANYDLAQMRLETEQAALRIREQNEALLEANEELGVARHLAEEAARLKTQFLATMSHELRTPLNAIIGYTEIQLAGMTGELSQEQIDYQKRVLANADHLLALINDILDIAKIEAGRLEILNKPFHLERWMNEVREQVQGLAQEKQLEFNITLDERMPTYIVGDPARIKQIALNLLSNAIKFTEKGFVRMQLRKHGRDTWMLIVRDSGMGIPPHLQETIFEEFRQVDSSSTRSQSGTGLGLAIVRKLALMMGGNVRLSSQLGEGSTFTIYLPLVAASETTMPKKE